MKIMKLIWHTIIDIYIVMALLPAFMLTAESTKQNMADWLNKRMAERRRKPEATLWTQNESSSPTAGGGSGGAERKI